MNGLPTLPKPTPLVLDSLYNHSATLLDSGDILEFASLKHKIVLVVNIGPEEDTLAREISHLERLAEKFSKDGLVILVFPCQQFSQTKVTERDVERKLQDVKNPNSSSETMVTFSPIKVNGSDAHPLYRYLCHTIPMPADDPITFINDPDRITWRPVLRSDVAGNCEKFLILPNGRPYKRYSNHFLTTNLGYDLKVVIKTLENVRREEASGVKYVLT